MSRNRKKHSPRKSERPGGAGAAARRSRHALRSAQAGAAEPPEVSLASTKPEQSMGLKTVYRAEVKYLQIMDEEGRLDEAAAGDIRELFTDEKLLETYREMIVARELDDAAFKLQRSGRMGTYPQNRGQEAVAFGAAAALKKGHDHIIPAYRENAALFQHGLPMHYVLLHWMGDERGNQIDPGQYHVSPICVEIGAQCLHGAGWAWAFKIQNKKHGTDKVAMIFFGDGATSEGDFHEGMNFASVLKAPAVFVCQNNGWAISVPTSKQSASETFAQKALAYGMPTLQVDGNDILAVYKACRQMVGHARSGKGPGFVEALTYRLADHTTADDASRYRPAEELEQSKRRDPFVRLRKFLESKGLWNEAKQAEATERGRKIVREVIHAATSIASPASAEMFNHCFAELPPDIVVQKESMCTAVLVQNPEQERLRESEEAEVASAR
jgi:pyruvate dehydrogenase E1 component alpha subunit